MTTSKIFKNFVIFLMIIYEYIHKTVRFPTYYVYTQITYNPHPSLLYISLSLPLKPSSLLSCCYILGILLSGFCQSKSEVSITYALCIVGPVSILFMYFIYILPPTQCLGNQYAQNHPPYNKARFAISCSNYTS